jgi:hypothetical protein
MPSPKLSKQDQAAVDAYFESQDDYYEELEEYEFNCNGSYEASKGDYEGACLARAEYEAGYMS